MRFATAFPTQYAALQAGYQANGHAYHNWAHIQALLKDFERLINQFADPLAVEVALYYHDIVYLPGAQDNEVNSARLLTQEMSGLIPEETVARAEAIVLATASHQVPDTGDAALSADCQLFLDMDLAILGAPPEQFAAYDAAIRSEYGAIPDQVFLPARRSVMKGFLERSRIYLTETFPRSHDGPARQNLRRLVNSLA